MVAYCGGKLVCLIDLLISYQTFCLFRGDNQYGSLLWREIGVSN